MNKQHVVFVGSFLMIMAVGYFDYLTGAHVSVMLLYAVPILLSARFCGRTEGIIVAASAAICWFIVNFFAQHSGSSEAVLSWNAFSRFGLFALLAYTVSLQVALKNALLREKLRADTDKLTGLLNKGAFRERVEEEMDRAKRYHHPLSLAFMDLDNFKQVNDAHGHTRGDKLLQLVSETIEHTIRKTDIAGRIGGDEFALCFPETGPDHIRDAIEKLLKNMDIVTSQSGWQVTSSIGVTTYVEIRDTYDAMLGKADKLMYIAKEKGKNGAEYLVV